MGVIAIITQLNLAILKETLPPWASETSLSFHTIIIFTVYSLAPLLLLYPSPLTPSTYPSPTTPSLNTLAHAKGHVNIKFLRKFWTQQVVDGKFLFYRQFVSWQTEFDIYDVISQIPYNNVSNSLKRKKLSFFIVEFGLRNDFL